MSRKPVITNVYRFPNGMVAVTDQFGHQMPEYQGPAAEVEEKIRAVYSGRIIASAADLEADDREKR